ncbi:MAG TPA: hypothetical protein ENI62_04495 [Gammaproteobacteria bacterium]|mgnify:CR=1 FL=1|nr:hypothetical protein [Gammaproteobacteria bacterium]
MKKIFIPIVVIFLLGGCGGGGSSSGADSNSRNIATTVAAADGPWAGNWTNVSFSTTGTVSLDVTDIPGAETVTLTLDLNGSVFGRGDPAPIILIATYPGDVAQGVAHTALGIVSMTLTADGDISGTMTSVPVAGIDSVHYSGTVTSGAVNIAYSIVFTDGTTANGTLNLLKT